MIDLGPVLLLPVGRPAREDLETLSRDLSAKGTACKVGRSVPLPQCAYDRRRNQYLANAFLSRRRRPQRRWPIHAARCSR